MKFRLNRVRLTDTHIVTNVVDLARLIKKLNEEKADYEIRETEGIAGEPVVAVDVHYADYCEIN